MFNMLEPVPPASQWLQEVQSTLQDKGIDSEVRPRGAPLRLGGVGKGAQRCNQDMTIPLAMARQDGSIKGGTFTAPVIESSSAPALLGLRSLTEHRAVLDLVSNQLHLLGPGEPRVEFPAGTETFNLERAPTGHVSGVLQTHGVYSRGPTSVHRANC